MIRNYLLTAVRNFASHKLYTAINVGGLAVALTCAIFIVLFVRDEISYDKWIPDSGDIYRVEMTFHNPGQELIHSPFVPYAIAQPLADQIPQIKAVTRLARPEMTVIIGDRQFSERADVVDPNFFQVIKLPFAEGNPADVFIDPESVVLSESTARKYFGSATGNIGKTIVLSGKKDCGQDANMVCTNKETRGYPLIVKGIIRDLPHNTQLAADIVIPNTSGADPMTRGRRESWTSIGGLAYVLLTPKADPKAVVARLKTIIDHSVDTAKLMNLKMPASLLLEPSLTRFQDGHFVGGRYLDLSTMPAEFQYMTPAGSRTTVYGFLVIGVLILLVACFNFTNLATARAAIRAREISLRKTVGAKRSQLIVQFLSEALAMALLSLVLALAAVEPLLPIFDRFLGKPIAFHYVADWPVLLGVSGIAIVAGLVSGIYPAIVLSSFRPAAILKVNAATQSGSGVLRTALVVMQFAVSIGLGVAVLVVSAQISFARQIDLGFRTTGIVIIDGGALTPTARESFKQALRANPEITGVAFSDSMPSTPAINNVAVQLPGGTSKELFHSVSITPEYVALYGVRLVAGRLLSDAHSEDAIKSDNVPFNVLLDAAGARRFGYSPEEAIGKTISADGTTVTIVGVIANLQVGGVKQSTTGTIYINNPEYMPFISVGVNVGHLADTLSFIDKTWHSFVPTFAIKRHFLSDDFIRLLEDDQKQGTIFTLFVGIAIFIACLGLFGLAAFTAERRTKEIGLRKTFGAKTRHIVLLLLWQFSIPVLIANLIAWPVAYYYLHGWLEGYADRIVLNPLYFLGAGALALAIAWATVYARAYRVARANPINALRYE